MNLGIVGRSIPDRDLSKSYQPNYYFLKGSCKIYFRRPSRLCKDPRAQPWFSGFSPEIFNREDGPSSSVWATDPRRVVASLAKLEGCRSLVHVVVVYADCVVELYQLLSTGTGPAPVEPTAVPDSIESSRRPPGCLQRCRPVLSMEASGCVLRLNFRVASRVSCRVCGMQATTTPTQTSMHDQMTPSSTSSSQC